MGFEDAHWHRWARMSLLPLALLTLLPLAVVLGSWRVSSPEVWAHLRTYVLPDVLANTLILGLGVGLLVVFMGISLGWLVAVCEFPGRAFFNVALVLPLALPSYVLAFVHVGLLDYSGGLQTAWRALSGSTQGLPAVRSLGGATAVFALSLFPYVYLMAREGFMRQGVRSLEAAQTLGLNRWQGFWRVAMPMSRPWWMAGASLALMELLADFGTVSIFNVDTFTTAIYKTWLGMFDLAVASQLASLLAGVVLLLLLMEKRARGRRRFAQGGQASAALGAYRIQLKSHQAWLASAWCALVWLAAFAVPVLQLLVWAWQSAAQDLDARYWAFVWHTMLLASLTAGLVVLAGLWLAYVQRLQPGRRVGAMVSVATMGYALPGMVLSIGLFIPIAWVDQQLAELAQVLGWSTPLLLKGSMAVMLLALAARFMAVGFEPVQAVMQRITPHQEQAARGLGLGRWQVLRRLFVPLLRPGLFSALLLVFVEVMKEMPITLMTRPFGWDTLAVRVFEMTSEGMWERAALPSLCIVLVGLIPVVLLVKESESSP